MGNLFLQAQPSLNFWNGENGSTGLWVKILIALLAGIAMIVVLMKAPSQARRPIVAFVTFISGLFYVLYFFWPRPVDRQPGELPRDFVESVSFYIDDAFGIVTDLSSVLSGLLLGLGIYSLLSVHLRRIAKKQKDWAFSIVLLISMVTMTFIGYADWISRQGEAGIRLEDRANWGPLNFAKDLMFDGILQNMDAAMFSIIAFYILSAAYRAFRVRSVEATILLATALIVILSLMGAVEFLWNGVIDGITGKNADSFMNNLKLTEISKWLRDTVQGAAIRGIDFGVGIGALAMGLRIWLSLEKGGAGGKA
jgi:hypothetical protein